MKKFIDIINSEVSCAFDKAGYNNHFAKVQISNRPDLADYQCNGAMALAKEYKKPPIQIATAIVEELKNSKLFSQADAVNPGFINLKISDSFIGKYLEELLNDGSLGLIENNSDNKVTVIDYGGPNVAKALHIGHLRSAIIGEAIKRIGRKLGKKIVGDVHLGDFGLQMGLIITELQAIKPELVYFKDDFDNNLEGYRDEIIEPPFTILELNEIYPRASAISKENDEYKAKAINATKLLQEGKPSHVELFKHIIKVSVSDLKDNYKRLNVDFDLWLGESDVQDLIPSMVKELKAKGLAKLDKGMLVVDVKQDTDKKEVPPCIIQKSDGSSLYATTDLATLVKRNNDFDLEEVIYVVDKRQELHFTQVFRVARMAGIIKDNVKLTFIGFGTICGEDGKPLKSRDGGAMKLQDLLDETHASMIKKLEENRNFSAEEADNIAELTAIAAIKYGDLSNQPSKDYIYNDERFTSYEGNTGPYILYSLVRMKSILNKAMEQEADIKLDKLSKENISKTEKDLMSILLRYNQVVGDAYANLAPNRVCGFIYDLCEAFNRFYHDTPILKEENKNKKAELLALVELSRKILEDCLDMLAIGVPERM